MPTANPESDTPRGGRRRRPTVVKNDGIVCYGGTQNVTNCAVGPGASINTIRVSWENGKLKVDVEGGTDV